MACRIEAIAKVKIKSIKIQLAYLKAHSASFIHLAVKLIILFASHALEAHGRTFNN